MSIYFEKLTGAQMQAFSDFLLKELKRHVDDIVQIVKDLEKIEKEHGILPTAQFVDKYIEL